MRHRALTGSGDFTFGNGKGNFATDENAIELNIATRLRSWKNDCFFDYDAGIDWLTRLDKNQKDNLINDLKALIIQSYGVVRINTVEVSEDSITRALTISYNVDTIFSQSFTSQVAVSAGAVGS